MLTDDGKHLYVSWDEYHQPDRAPGDEGACNQVGSSIRFCAWHAAVCVLATSVSHF
jgi:hypothetical protein